VVKFLTFSRPRPLSDLFNQERKPLGGSGWFKNDLVLMDQRFLSYGMFWNIQHRGAYFGIRLHPQARPKSV
jgi:hypothetical protein